MEFPGISVGLDIEDLARWREPDLRVTDRPGRVFTAAEHDYCMRQADPAPHFAARWCAKEAAVKALAPLGQFVVGQFEIVRSDSGSVAIAWREGGPPAQLLSLQVSLSHSQMSAAAVAVAAFRVGTSTEPAVR